LCFTVALFMILPVPRATIVVGTSFCPRPVLIQTRIIPGLFQPLLRYLSVRAQALGE
jgi:hypothetical protein